MGASALWRIMEYVGQGRGAQPAGLDDERVSSSALPPKRPGTAFPGDWSGWLTFHPGGRGPRACGARFRQRAMFRRLIQ